jgi:hypothetical protein
VTGVAAGVSLKSSLKNRDGRYCALQMSGKNTDRMKKKLKTAKELRFDLRTDDIIWQDNF